MGHLKRRVFHIMLEGQYLVYFGPEPWEGLWRNRHQLMSVFARRNKVLYVEPRIYLRSLRSLFTRRGREKIGRSQTWRPRLTKARENLYVYGPPALTPISGRPPLRELLDYVDRGLLRRAMKRLGLQSPFIWLSRPSMIGRIGQFDERMVIYHVVDEYAAYGDMSGAAREIVQEQERQLLRLADLVIVVSQPLLEAKKPYNSNTHLVPNAVNYEAFVEILNNQPTQPADLAAIPRPVIGYSGLISSRLDFALLTQLAGAHPEWSWVFVGSVKGAQDDPMLKRLQGLSNVYFLGPKPIASVPYYVSGFDVALIPYRLTEETRNASPLKLYDYLACGKPVVSVDVPAVRPYAHLVQIVPGPAQFESAIETSLSEPEDGRVAQRRAVVAAQTWTQRAAHISDLIRQTLETREDCRASERRAASV
jgi:glycosyltransferase involved in cell wall biosynthesis